MSAVRAALTGLEQDAQGRVLRWAAERHGIALSTGRVRRDGTGGGGATGDYDDRSEDATEEKISPNAPVFEHFAELFAKTQPATDADKALIAGYWRQAIQGEDKWQAAELQKELKNLGHSVGNITDALTANIQKRPQRIIQLRKAGNAQQARKTYKVTHEGLAHVRGMLGGDVA